MGEQLTLVFKDGKTFHWDTRKIRDSLKAVKLQRKLGDPIEIIGEGYTANYLRESYAGEEVKLSIHDLSISAIGKTTSMKTFNKVIEKAKKLVGIKEDKE